MLHSVLILSSGREPTPLLLSFGYSELGFAVALREIRKRVQFPCDAGAQGQCRLRECGEVRISRKKRVTLARKSFTVPASGKVTLTIKLSKKNLRILKLNRKIRTQVTVKLRNTAGLTSSASKKITLKASKPRRR